MAGWTHGIEDDVDRWCGPEGELRAGPLEIEPDDLRGWLAARGESSPLTDRTDDGWPMRLRFDPDGRVVALYHFGDAVGAVSGRAFAERDRDVVSACLRSARPRWTCAGEVACLADLWQPDVP